MINLRIFQADEWKVYKELRLSALSESPDAFSSTLARASLRSDTDWANRLSTGVNSATDLPLVAEIEGLPIGLAWGGIDDANPAVANLYQVWVAPTHRRLGVGEMLLNTVIAWATAKQLYYLELHVTCGDTSAVRLYTRAGFKPVGQPQPMRPGSTLLEQRMRLTLKRDAI